MKVTKTHARLLGYAGLSVASYAVVMVMLGAVFGIRRYDLKVDERINPALNTQLSDQVQGLPCGLYVQPAVSAQNIQQQFPWIQSVSFFRVPTKEMRVAVTVDEPQVIVNGAVITEHARVLPASTFVPKALSQVPMLQIKFRNAYLAEIPESFISHAKTFTQEQFKPYTLSWVDAYSARLTDKEQPLFTILFNTQTIPDATMFAHCASIKQKLQERGSFTGRYKGVRWVADIRFDRQVIVFSENKGGMTHG